MSLSNASAAASVRKKSLRAAPYWITLTFVPLVLLAVLQGGWTILLIPFYGWILMTILDSFLGPDASNPDADTPDSELLWFRVLTWIWVPIEAVLLFGTIWYLTHHSNHSTLEIIGIMFGIGVTTGTVGIVYAHELFHKTNRFEPILGDILLAMVLYGHFRTEHMLVHHPHVGTPRDTVTGRYNEGFHRFFPRVLKRGPGSAWRAEAAMLARRNLPATSLRNPIWKYLALGAVMLALAFLVGGWLGIVLLVFQAFIAIWQLELTNYVEHYGLTRRYLGDGKYEPVRPHHSWDSVHQISNLLLINLQRHADHHCHPTRRFPLLQSYSPDEAPQLSHGYPLMTAMAMIPPLWRRVMNPKVRQWRRQFYPEIEDWTPYRNLSFPAPTGAG
ncbi:MAG: alkane 1-monooxygenase [Rhodobacteraceae bacterium]|nr:alkane 1-monooxygenase [Paracoccaceae bacterium]